MGDDLTPWKAIFPPSKFRHNDSLDLYSRFPNNHGKQRPILDICCIELETRRILARDKDSIVFVENVPLLKTPVLQAFLILRTKMTLNEIFLLTMFGFTPTDQVLQLIAATDRVVVVRLLGQMAVVCPGRVQEGLAGVI